ncbi:hypothetical protein DES38_104185 [Streptohalobacillus salinus]|uniref:YpoC-like domain-containing protein n=1 Tax=Streptohalobacillus salinus TaxID=621096 RepID=A0A2V3WCM2_9BACI|nr:hypothetical protein [Streptohalobacillus salinus]PXW91752.1 hypothetical protein DES38_104185 [Streptohalobacillus salinus]
MNQTIIENWKTAYPALVNLYKTEQYQATVAPMKEAATDFETSLYQLNDADPTTPIHMLRYKPINIEERLAYVNEHPNQYHACLQLNGLFEELEKLIAKKQIIDEMAK